MKVDVMLRPLLASTFLLAVPVAAWADAITQTGTITGSGQPDYTLVYDDFAGFDTGLGTLQSAYVTASLFLNMAFNYGTVVPPTSSAVVSVSLDIVSSVGGQPSVIARSAQTQTDRYMVNGNSYYLPVQAQATSLTGAFGDAALASLAKGNGFGLVLGGSAQAPGYAYSYVSGIPDSRIPAFQASATVTYVYQPAVPEPATMLVSSTALAALAFVRRRRHA